MRHPRKLRPALFTMAAAALVPLAAVSGAVPSPQARAAPLPAAAPPGHVILKAGSGKAATTLALATTGKPGGPVYAGRFRASNHAEDWHADHEPGGSFPGGRFGFFYAPGGVQTDLYVHAGAASYLVTGASAATVFTAVPEAGGYVALEYLPGGAAASSFVLTYAGGGHVILAGGGVPLRPTADQLWKVTG